MTDTTTKTAEALLREAAEYAGKHARWSNEGADLSDRITAFLAAQPQAEPVAADYGHTDHFCFAGVPVSDAGKRLGSMLVLAFGGKHPAIDDLCELLLLAGRPPVAQQGAAEGVAWRTKFDELLEDYAMARVETALFNAKVIQRGRLSRPRLEALQQHVATLTPQPAAAQPVAQGLTTETDLALKALDRTYYRGWVKQPHGYVCGNVSIGDLVEVIEFARAALSVHPAQADEGDSNA